MPSSFYFQNIAIVGGTGNLGGIFVHAFLKTPNIFKVRLLVSDSSFTHGKNAVLESFQNHGAEIVKVDFTHHESLVKALLGVDVILSALNGDAIINQQLPLIEAAQYAGVQLFIPSEFGMDLDTNLEYKYSVLVGKQAIRRALVQAQNRSPTLKGLIVLGGLFTDFDLDSWCGFDFDDSGLLIRAVSGAENKPMPWVVRSDVARYLVELLQNITWMNEIRRNSVPGKLDEIVLITERQSAQDIYNMAQGIVKSIPNKNVQLIARPKADVMVSARSNFGDFLWIMLDSGKLTFNKMPGPGFEQLQQKVTLDNVLSSKLNQKLSCD